MTRIALEDLFVVVYPHTDGYSHDTGTPDEVFSTREEAQVLADESNEHIVKSDALFARSGKKFYVESLSDRLQIIKDECRLEGEHNKASAQ
jgi:hypothetical protein